MEAEHRELDALGVGGNGERDWEEGYEEPGEAFDEGWGAAEFEWSGTSEPEPERCRGLDCLALYRREAGRYPRPDAEEEERCFRVIGRAKAETGTTPGPPPELARAAEDARQRMLLGHLGLVIQAARRYSRLYGGCSLPPEDLIQEGNLGLLGALDRFDPEQGRRFAAFARGEVRSSMCRALSTKARTIRIPLEILNLRRLLASVMSDLRQRCGNETFCDGRRHAYRLEEVAAAIGVAPDRVGKVLLLVPQIESLDAPESPEGEPLIEFVADPAAPNPRDEAAALEARDWLPAVLARLSPRQLQVIRLRYGFDSGPGLSFAAIGRALRISGQRARELHQRALRHLSEAARRSFSAR